jgi:hypothetical protein
MAVKMGEEYDEPNEDQRRGLEPCLCGHPLHTSTGIHSKCESSRQRAIDDWEDEDHDEDSVFEWGPEPEDLEDEELEEYDAENGHDEEYEEEVEDDWDEE